MDVRYTDYSIPGDGLFQVRERTQYSGIVAFQNQTGNSEELLAFHLCFMFSARDVRRDEVCIATGIASVVRAVECGGWSRCRGNRPIRRRPSDRPLERSNNARRKNVSPYFNEYESEFEFGYADRKVPSVLGFMLAL